MDLIEQTKIETIENRNWDFYRTNYLNDNYSYSDLIKLNEYWYSRIREQSFFHIKWVHAFFQRYSHNYLEVIELGCYRGELATAILNNYQNIAVWLGCDICYPALINSASPDKFKPYWLDSPFYSFPTEFIGRYDTFVSTHTLEHFSTEQAIKILDLVHQGGISKIFLEMPIPEEGKIWKRGASSHVLQMGRKHFREWFLKNKWKISFERQKGMNWSIATER